MLWLRASNSNIETVGSMPRWIAAPRPVSNTMDRGYSDATTGNARRWRVIE